MNSYILTSRDYKFYLKVFSTIVIVLLLLISLINIIVDPLYTFKITNNIDIKQKDFNERVQKTNYLKFVNSDFDSLLLGSSRATYIDTNKLPGKVFNYAVSAVSVNEYDDVLQSFIKITGKVPKTIYIGIDPFSFGRPENDQIKRAFENTEDIFYPYKNLVSLDIFRISIKNIVSTYKFNQNIYDRKQRFYDKKLVKGIQTKNNISNKSHILASKGYILKVYKNINLKALKKLKKKYSQSKFVIFTMPVHEMLYKDIKNQKNYNLWLKNLVNIFGTVYHFMYENEISKSYYTFFDAFHFYPYVGKEIVEKIKEFETTTDINDSFGIILNSKNIDSYLQNHNSRN